VALRDEVYLSVWNAAIGDVPAPLSAQRGTRLAIRSLHECRRRSTILDFDVLQQPNGVM